MFQFGAGFGERKGTSFSVYVRQRSVSTGSDPVSSGLFRGSSGAGKGLRW